MKVLRSLILLSLFFTSCRSDEGGSGGSSSRTLPGSNGGKLDVIVVAEEALWQSVAGDMFRKHFTEAQPVLPQPEPSFTVRQIAPESFSTLLQRSRNIVILSKGSAGYELERNKWARPQIVISVAAEDERSLARLISAKQDEMTSAIKTQELLLVREMMKGGLRPNPEVLEKHNVSMSIPQSFELEQEQDDLLVFWNRTIKTDQGITIYFRPMPETMGPLGQDIISIRDSLTAFYIQAEREGGHMVTEDVISPVYRNTEVDGQFAVEVRGLWRTTNTFMGGPFLSYMVYDEKNQQIIFMDAFVYSPETKKRNFMLELEAILRSLEIGE